MNPVLYVQSPISAPSRQTTLPAFSGKKDLARTDTNDSFVQQRQLERRITALEAGLQALSKESEPELSILLKSPTEATIVINGEFYTLTRAKVTGFRPPLDTEDRFITVPRGAVRGNSWALTSEAETAVRPDGRFARLRKSILQPATVLTYGEGHLPIDGDVFIVDGRHTITDNRTGYEEDGLCSEDIGDRIRRVFWELDRIVFTPERLKEIEEVEFSPQEPTGF